jgi:hypothetical protein
MKLPTRTIAIVIWALGVTVIAAGWYASLMLAHNFPTSMSDTPVTMLMRADNSLTYLWEALGLGAIIWVLGEIRDRPTQK